MLKIECYHVGLLKTNCYLIEDKDTCEKAIIDPGSNLKVLDDYVERNKLDIKYILLTHGHFDHIKAVSRYKNITGSKVVACKQEEKLIYDPSLNLSHNYTTKGIDEFVVDIFLEDGQKINLGNTEITLLYTPGHTYGSCCYIADGVIFSGDTLFREEIGRTDLATGSYNDMMDSLKKLYNLCGDYKVYPGHGDTTDLEFEKKNNKYLRSCN